MTWGCAGGLCRALAGVPAAAAVQLASQALLLYWAGSETETGQEPVALKLGEPQVKQQVEPLLTLWPTLNKTKEKNVKDTR